MIYPTHSGVKVFLTPEDIEQEVGTGTSQPPSLVIRDLAGKPLLNVATSRAWNLELVLEQLNGEKASACVVEAGGADAYIGTQWIGGTEV